jgi:hypothetical protein
LRPAGDGIGHRGLILRPGLATEELREAIRRELAGGVEESGRDLVDLVVEAVALEAVGDDAVIVRPDGTDVVTERVVADSLAGEGSDAPATEHVVAEEGVAGAAGALGVDDAAPERLPGVGRHDLGGLFVAIQGQRKMFALG